MIWTIEVRRFERDFYEWYGPGGVAILVKTLTDNTNRTSANIRTTFSSIDETYENLVL